MTHYFQKKKKRPSSELLKKRGRQRIKSADSQSEGSEFYIASSIGMGGKLAQTGRFGKVVTDRMGSC